MKICFSSVFLDHSGYAQAARNILLAMVEAGIEVTTEIVSFARGDVDETPGAKKALELQSRFTDYDKKIIMLTPENYPKYYENGKKNIGLLFWEVIGVDGRWVNYMNKMTEIWTPSEIFAKTFRDNGVTVPVRVITQPYQLINEEQPFNTQGGDMFKFYSVFQWTERKNPKALLETYWKTFSGVKDVCLILKTYRGSFTPTESNAIRDDIRKWKLEISNIDFPKTYFIPYEMSEQDIQRLHATGDCFVSAHRGEGWGYPQMEAMCSGKPVISTNFGGIHEHMTDEFAWPIKYKFTKVTGMSHIPWYNETQQWAEIDRDNLSKSMWEAYSKPELAKKKGQLAKQKMIEKFSNETVVNEIMGLLWLN